MALDDAPVGRLLTRREVVALLALCGAGLLGRSAAAAPVPGCVVRPEQTEGPYFVEERLNRSDIRSDPATSEVRPGAVLQLAFKVSSLRGAACTPLAGAVVDVWHCDALGVYSGVSGNRGTFLRGVQRTDANGWAAFDTVYPGWYPGRAVHVHVKVHVGGDVVHTGQFFFPAGISDAIARRAPYNRHGRPDTQNATDAIFRNGGSRSMLALTRRGTGYVGSLTMGVRR
jgi:protocatechuate 3,4-dioxygenase beta subunit